MAPLLHRISIITKQQIGIKTSQNKVTLDQKSIPFHMTHHLFKLHFIVIIRNCGPFLCNFPELNEEI